MSEFRKRVLIPVAIPLAAFGFIGVLALAFSRVLLAVPEAGSTTLAFLLSAMILAVASVLAAAGSKLKRSQKMLVLTSGIAVLIAGVASAQIGIREIEVHGEEVHIVAQDLAFDTQVLELPADAEVSLVFENLDEGVPHDVDIASDDSFAELLFDGAVFPGVATETYSVPPIAAGGYAFRCSIHPPQMTGTVIVGGEGGGHGEPTGGEEPAEEPGHGAEEPGGHEEPAPQEPTNPPVVPGEGDEEPSGPTSTTVIAEDIAYDVDAFTLAAGVPTTIEFDNRDAGIPHDIDIATDDSFSTIVFDGETFSGEEVRTYQLDPIPAGTYAFRCSIHPTQMTGTAIFE